MSSFRFPSTLGSVWWTGGRGLIDGLSICCHRGWSCSKTISTASYLKKTTTNSASGTSASPRLGVACSVLALTILAVHGRSLCLRHQHYLTCLVPGSDCSADSTYVWKAGTCIFFGEHNTKYSFQEHVDECVSAGGGPVTFAESDDYVLFQTRLAEHESASGRQYNAGLWIGLSNRVYAIDERVGGTSGASGVVRASEWARTPRRPVRSTLTHACVCHAGGTAACRKCGDIECCWKAVRCGHHGIHVAGRAVR